VDLSGPDRHLREREGEGGPVLRRAGRSGRSGRGALAAILALAVFAIAAAGGADPKAEATYKGKSAREWADELARGSMDAFFAITAPEKEAVPVLAEMLHSDLSRVRSVAAQGLAEVAADAVPVVSDIGRVLKDTNLNARYYAAQALKGMGPAAAPAVPALIDALDTHPSREPDLEGPPRDYKDARWVAADALAAIGPAAKGALPRLREVAARDDQPEVRAAAAEAIKKIEGK
jgi:HEAT repeat protein